MTGFLHQQGRRLRQGIDRIADTLRLRGYFDCLGRDCCLLFGTKDTDKRPSQPMRTLFLQETIRRGVIAPAFVVSYSHTDRDIDRTIEIVGEALAVYRKALDEGVEKYLHGAAGQAGVPAIRVGFRVRIRMVHAQGLA